MSNISNVQSVIPYDLGNTDAGGDRVSEFITMLTDATPEQAADILGALEKGRAIWNSRKETETKTKAETLVKPKAEMKAKANAKAPRAKPALPEAADGAPEASEYRITHTHIDHTICVGREFAGEDKRWKPYVFRESQCGAKLVEGSDLCTKCARRQEKYAVEPKPGPWKGRVTEEPLDWIHMLGTAWAEEKAPTFLGASEASEASEASDSEPAEAVAQEIVVQEKEKEMITTVTKHIVKDKAAKKAEKEAEKAEKEAAKAAKAAEKAAKAAEKEAAKAAKAAEKEAKAPKAKKAEKAEKTAVKAKTKDAEVAHVVGDLKLIDGTIYLVKNGNVYDYDEMSEKAGDFVGRISHDTIDPDAQEVTADESESD